MVSLKLNCLLNYSVCDKLTVHVSLDHWSQGTSRHDCAVYSAFLRLYSSCRVGGKKMRMKCWFVNWGPLYPVGEVGRCPGPERRGYLYHMFNISHTISEYRKNIIGFQDWFQCVSSSRLKNVRIFYVCTFRISYLWFECIKCLSIRYVFGKLISKQ